MLNNKLNSNMCELFSIGVKNESSIKFVTDFWDNPRKYKYSELVFCMEVKILLYLHFTTFMTNYITFIVTFS
jgi:hypothetical protein